MTGTYRSRADQRTADDVGIPQALMCAAHDCPNRWSVDMGSGRLCSAHDRAEPHHWPEVTQQQQWDETERARLRAETRPDAPAPRFASAERMHAAFRHYAQKVRERERDPKRWARKLKAREEGGEKLSELQRNAWRTALRAPTESVEE